MKAKKTSKSTRAKKATRDLPVAGRTAPGKVVGGQASKQDQNLDKKNQIRDLQKALD
jgi:hypothetical protein